MSEATAALVGDNGGAGDAGAQQDTGSQADPTQQTQPTENPQSGGTEAPSWMEGLGDDQKAYIQNKGWKDPADMFKSYQNLEKFAGGSKNLLELPGEDADEDSMSEFFNKLGRPETPDQYGFKAPETADPELDKWYREAAHKHGLTESQAAGLFEEYNGMLEGKMEQTVQSLEQRSAEEIKGLEKEWGRDYQKNLDQGRIAAKALGYDEKTLSELEGKMGTSEMLKLMANLGSKMGEHSFEVGQDSTGFGVSDAQARIEIQNLKLDKGFMDKYMSGDKDAVAKYTRLMEKAYG